MPPAFELSVANLLPPATLLTLVSGVWSLYFFLHVLPQLQLNTPWAHYNHEMAERGWRHLVITQVLITLLLVSFFRASLTMPGDVPEGEAWRFGTFKDPNITQEMKFSGERRRCKHCLIYKPDRCHHCRICKSCVLKMDHHCPWIMNCIGFRNHKYFFLLIIYSMLCCAFIGITVFGSIVESVEQEMPVCQRFLLLLCFSTSSIMGGLLVVFAAFHVMLMLRGLTTIEFCEKMSIVSSGKCSKYDMGAYRNIMAVFGPRPYTWLLPLDPPAGDGLRFVKPRVRSFAAPRYMQHDPEWT